MNIDEATSLIKNADLPSVPTHWADLGCGSGLFTRALASLLPDGSSIHAIDRKPLIQAGIIPGKTASVETASGKTTSGPGVDIIPVKADFITGDLDLPPLDGILMANSLHYVADKQTFLRRIDTWLRPAAQILIVEYDTDRPIANWYPTRSASILSPGYSGIKTLTPARSGNWEQGLPFTIGESCMPRL